jgi:hypothetical protein
VLRDRVGQAGFFGQDEAPGVVHSLKWEVVRWESRSPSAWLSPCPSPRRW